jgi:hypothetical protein
MYRPRLPAYHLSTHSNTTELQILAMRNRLQQLVRVSQRNAAFLT